MKTVEETYGRFHQSHVRKHVYPTEWVVRTMLGRYPLIPLDSARYTGSKILDIGFGDGRNWPLLGNAGMEIHGVEITERIVQLGNERAAELGVQVTLRTGNNCAIPYEDAYFDYILASSSCYYLDSGTTFQDVLAEYARVLKPDGFLIANLPETGGSICDGGVRKEEGVIEIRNDPWGLRNGYHFRAFEDSDEVRRAFEPRFSCCNIGLLKDDYFGMRIHMFIVVARRG